MRDDESDEHAAYAARLQAMADELSGGEPDWFGPLEDFEVLPLETGERPKGLGEPYGLFAIEDEQWAGSGHAPGELLQAFEEAIEDGDEAKVHDLAGALWRCTDIMPSSLCDDLDVPPGSTYAQGARRVRSA